MRSTILMLLAMFGLFAFIVTGCGGGVDDPVTTDTTPSNTNQNTAPISNAGLDQTVKIGDSITLDGRGSYDPDGDVLTYRWIPAKLLAGYTPHTISSLAVEGTATFFPSPDVAGPYKIKLVVNDGVVDSSPDTVTITINASLPDTGQATSFTDTFGEDSDYLINPQSCSLNGDGTTTDNVTGLMWQSSDDGIAYNWYQATGTTDTAYNPSGATDVCDSLNTGGYTDWRLPTVKELQLIADYGRGNPAIDQTFFPDTKSFEYWSSTTATNATSSPWTINFLSGYSSFTNYRDDINYVRCVRGRQLSFDNFSDNGNGTVTAIDTSLVWPQMIDDTVMTWESALSYCEGLDFAGAKDWRLPNIKELDSIVDRASHNPSIDEIFFPGIQPSIYWSSTTKFDNSYIAMVVNFTVSGTVTFADKTLNSFYARCVRGGH
ncbi:MAG: DUF1566 domain-containing protein [Thermodesulfobacteriota bacterium]